MKNFKNKKISIRIIITLFIINIIFAMMNSAVIHNYFYSDSNNIINLKMASNIMKF